MKPTNVIGIRSSLFSSTFCFLVLSNMASAALPQIDLNKMGQVALAGAFAGLDFFDNSSSLIYDSTTSTVLQRSSDGSLSRLGSTNPGGKIVAGCAIGSDFYFSGSFSSVNGTAASNVAQYSTSSDTFNALGSNGPNGNVQTLYCDTANNQVWAGGSFNLPGSNVAIWDIKSGSWNAPPFTGLSGPGAEVSSISTNSSSSSLFFTGSFLTSFQTNNTIVTPNDINNPNVPFSPGASPFSSSLVPIPLQGVQIVASPASSNPQFNNISNILCPLGPDGPGNTWLAADGSEATIIVREFAQLNAMGIRLGNTQQGGRGTVGFSFESIPDNQVEFLSYIDPVTGSNKTCTDPCPLSTDPSILYQDFIFSAPLSLTGFQLTLSEWQGQGSGLDNLQLLSTGSFVFAVPSDNKASCYSPNASNVTLNGNWTEEQVVTSIAATEQDILTALVDVGTSPSQAPSITFEPYVSASGQYQVKMLIPGCNDLQDCDSRTDVKVTVFPGGNLQPVVSTISQQNTDDVSVSIYTGPVFPSPPNFVMTVTMNLADQPTGNGQNNQYRLIADRLELLLSPDMNGTTTSNSGNVTNTISTVQSGFGFFEWPQSSNSNVNAGSTISNASETPLDNIAFALFNATGGASGVLATKDIITSVAFHSSGIFLGGNFNISAGANIVVYQDGQLVSLPEGGLNGQVNTMVIDGDILFVGGAFSGTVTSSNTGKDEGVISYDINSRQWVSLEAGVNGPVESLSLLDNQLAVAGSFTMLLSNDSDGQLGTSAGGFAIWSISNSTWKNPAGFVAGNMTFIGNSTTPSKGQQQAQILAGNVAASLKYGATGVVMLQNGPSNEDSFPEVIPLNIQLDGVSQTTSMQALQKRYPHKRSSWVSRLHLPRLFSRQSPPTISPLPPSPASPAPAVLSGTFWTNTTNSHEVMIIGGNFSTTMPSGLSEAVIFYDLTTGDVTGIPGSPLNGTVRALLTSGTSLYIGGEFNVSGSNVSGFAIVDLITGQLKMNGLLPLQATSGLVVVRSLTSSTSESNAVFVAGSFNSAGGSNCEGICRLDTNSNQWSQLGSGINGEIASVAYAGDNENILFASGSIALSGGTQANVATFSFSNSSWMAVGEGNELPGPVTALTVDNQNTSSVFAAGRSSDGQSAFLTFWNGEEWSSIGSFLGKDTNVSQLAMVPLVNTHPANGIIEQDRILMISGSLVSTSFGNASSVLFDGSSVSPYIVSVLDSGAPGSVYSLFSSITNFTFTQAHFLAVGIVILISIAISAGVVFLLALLGILWTLFARRDNTGKFDPAEFEDDDSTHHRPSSLLEHINAATRTTILGVGASSPFDDQRVKEEDLGAASTTHGHDPFLTNDGDYLRAETPSDAIAGLGAGTEEQSRPAHARYSFDGAGEGELPLSVGMELEVFDDRDHAWWYVRDVNTGREGVVPAAYLY